MEKWNEFHHSALVFSVDETRSFADLEMDTLGIWFALFSWLLIQLSGALALSPEGEAGHTPAPVLEIGEECRSTLIPREDVPSGAGAGSAHEFLPICDPLARLDCIGGRCQCKKGFTLNHNGTKCLEIARNGLDSSCEEDVQCWKGLLGRMSECVATLGRCRCYESDTVPIVFHQGRCYYGESLGDYCQIDGLCSTTTPNAICRTGVCQCLPNYVPSWDKSRCLPIATNGLNSSCEENIQCEKSGLGTLSECNQERMVCQCYHIPQISTIYYAGRCYFTATLLGDVCQVSPQCETRIRHSTCGADGKCRCLESEGYVATANNTACVLRPVIQTPAAPVVIAVGAGFNSSITTVVHSMASNDEISKEFLQPPAPAAPVKECTEDSHCTRVYGSFGRCNVTRGKCECYIETQITGNNGTVTEMIKCLPGKRLGEPCKYNRQCQAMNSASSCTAGLCECIEPTHILSQDGRKCLPISTGGFGAFCDEDPQCIKSSLGPLSICNEKTNTCECTGLLPMSLYKNTCYFQRWIGSFCLADDECRASLGEYAECHGGTCRCVMGFKEETFNRTCVGITNVKPIETQAPISTVLNDLYSNSSTSRISFKFKYLTAMLISCVVAIEFLLKIQCVA